jgi:hypothetical protein
VHSGLPERVNVRNLRTSITLNEVSELAPCAPGEKPPVLGVGAGACGSSGRARCAGAPAFSDLRTLVSDFLPAELFLLTMKKEALGKGLLAAATSVVMHLMGSPKGALPQWSCARSASLLWALARPGCRRGPAAR